VLLSHGIGSTHWTGQAPEGITVVGPWWHLDFLKLGETTGKGP